MWPFSGHQALKSPALKCSVSIFLRIFNVAGTGLCRKKWLRLGRPFTVWGGKTCKICSELTIKTLESQ